MDGNFIVYVWTAPRTCISGGLGKIILSSSGDLIESIRYPFLLCYPDVSIAVNSRSNDRVVPVVELGSPGYMCFSTAHGQFVKSERIGSFRLFIVSASGQWLKIGLDSVVIPDFTVVTLGIWYRWCI